MQLIGTVRALCQLLGALVDRRVHQGFELTSQGLVCEYEPPQCRAIQIALGVADLLAEVREQLRAQCAARRDQFARDLIGIQDWHAQGRKQLRYCALTAGDAAGEANAQCRVLGGCCSAHAPPAL
jgi:hypothetical protein